MLSFAAFSHVGSADPVGGDPDQRCLVVSPRARSTNSRGRGDAEGLYALGGHERDERYFHGRDARALQIATKSVDFIPSSTVKAFLTRLGAHCARLEAMLRTHRRTSG